MVFAPRRGFSGSRKGIRLRLDGAEVEVLDDLLSQLSALVAPDDGTAGGDDTDVDPLAALMGPPDGDRPSDPALLRLFPDGYRDDPEASGDFRRFTQSGLRQLRGTRLDTARGVLTRIDADSPDDLGTAQVAPDEAAALLGVVNDLRIVLGVRLEIVDDDQDVTDGWAPDDPRRATFGVYQWLTWLQAGLLEAMAGSPAEEK